MEVLIVILIILVLVLLNALFVAAEFAIVGVPRVTIERLAAQGHGMARQVRRIIRDPRLQDRYIATAQLGITFASLGLGMYGEHTLAVWIAHGLEGLGASRWIAAHALASVLAVGILTYLHIVLGEMVPKSLALLFAVPTALWVTPPMRGLQYAIYPLVVGLNAIGNGALRLLGVRREFASSHYHTPEEIDYLVQESAEGGLLRPEAGRVLRDLHEFGDLTAGEVMVPRVRVHGIPVEATSEQALAIVRQSRHTRYPVYRGSLDHVVGVMHIKELFCSLRAGRAFCDGGVRPVPYVPESMRLDAVLATMRREHAQMAVVMDEHGGTAGIITLEDLFEEVVGGIGEGASPARDMAWDEGDRLRVLGTARVEEVGEALGAQLEHEEVDTVSGLVLTLLGRPPAVGDVVMHDRVRFEVIGVDGHGVGVCLVTSEAPAAPEAS